MAIATQFTKRLNLMHPIIHAPWREAATRLAWSRPSAKPVRSGRSVLAT